MRHDARDIEHLPVQLRRIHDITRESMLRADALRLLDLRLDRLVVTPVRMLMQLRRESFAHYCCQCLHLNLRQIADRPDAVTGQFLTGPLPHPKQIPHRERPHFPGHFFRP